MKTEQYNNGIIEALSDLAKQKFPRRFWDKDTTLWSSEKDEQDQISNALGWLEVAEKMKQRTVELREFVDRVKEQGYSHVVHMGMGGSSLAPLAFKRIFPIGPKGLPVTVLDTTDPATLLEIENTMPLENTLFIIASKSGTTDETHAFEEYFYGKLKDSGKKNAGENFAVITDPSTPLLKRAEERKYFQTFVNFIDIGGRYSALSYFGLVPASLYGLDMADSLSRALEMVDACGSKKNIGENPGIMLGAVMGYMALNGRDKVTLLLPDALLPLGMWIEQLLAESTGKKSTGLMPVAGEPIGHPLLYGKDRLFVYVRLKHELDLTLDRSVDRLKKGNLPVFTIELEDRLDIFGEFFRWEVAVATAGSILGINPFNQPNVQESKDNTKKILETLSGESALPHEKPDLEEEGLAVYGDSESSGVEESISRFFSGLEQGDYTAILAYLTEERSTENALRDICRLLQEHFKIAATLGYGPRYLHSTGQYHKGGTNRGRFLLLTGEGNSDPGIPGKSYGFGTFRKAQAEGDFQALKKHGRKILRIHIGMETGEGIMKIKKIIRKALL